MKTLHSTKTRDYLLIVLSVFVIFGCGFAASHVLTEKTNAPLPADLTAWEGHALLNLRRSLDIRPEQETEVVKVLKATQASIDETRQRALLEYHFHLLNSHEQIAPHLDAEQQKTMLKSRKKLEGTIREKFPQLLKDHHLNHPGPLVH